MFASYLSQFYDCIEASFLSEDLKEAYKQLLEERWERLEGDGL